VASDLRPLERLIAGLEQLAESGVQDITAELEPEIQEVVDDQYAEGRGPEGETWAPLKRSGRPSHLQDTGDMSAASRALRGVKGVTVTIPSPAQFHQGGTSRMVPRKLVPDGEPLPRRWGEAAREVSVSVIAEKLKG
jgi:hypothetical protein